MDGSQNTKKENLHSQRAKPQGFLVEIMWKSLEKGKGFPRICDWWQLGQAEET